MQKSPKQDIGKITTIAATTIIAAAILATAPLLIGLQIAKAANTTQVSATGSSGQISCPSQQQVVVNWHFQASKQRGSVTGSWYMDNGDEFKYGDIVSGIIANSHFILIGQQSYDSMCSFFTTPATITLTGACGSAAVQFRISTGESGTLIGNVACT